MQALRRAGAGLLVAVATMTIGAASAPLASAAPFYPVHQDIYATTTIKKSGMVVRAPKGTFDGSIDLANGNLTGTMNLPPSSMTVSLLGVTPLATITFAMEPTKPVTGHVNMATFESTTTSVFNIHLTKVSPQGADSVNLVGDRCRTSTPISITMKGKASPTTASTFKGSFTIPDFEHCRTMTQLLNALIPGPDNTFTALFGPAGTPPPPPPPAPEPLTIQAHVRAEAQVGGVGSLSSSLSGAAALPVPAPAPDSSLFGWLLQAQ